MDFINMDISGRIASQAVIAERGDILIASFNLDFYQKNTGNDLYFEYGNFELVKKFMSREEIDRFEQVRKEAELEKERAKAWGTESGKSIDFQAETGRTNWHLSGDIPAKADRTDLQQLGDIWVETYEALREYGPDEFGDSNRLISDIEMER